MARHKLRCGDCLDVMPTIKDNGIDAIICDPPYGLKFMGKDWDHGIPGVRFWKEALRVAKPGAHLLAFGGTRTHHRLMCAIEDAGWEIRDCLMWVYGSGFPKSHNISKAIDKAAGAEREVVATTASGGYKRLMVHNAEDGFRPADYYPEGNKFTSMEPVTPGAAQWDGWGTALKPAWEPIILARKPLEGTVAANVLEWGVGGLNIDACRIEANNRPLREVHPLREDVSYNPHSLAGRVDGSLASSKAVGTTNLGRWPANFLLDEEAAEMLDQASGVSQSPKTYIHSADGLNNNSYGAGMGQVAGVESANYGDEGGASRFFYCAKASKSDRGAYNNHPTVKPTSLLRYLCKLVTPPNGIVLDPFMGSGSTGKAALLENFLFYGIEKDKKYFDIAVRRLGEIT